MVKDLSVFEHIGPAKGCFLCTGDWHMLEQRRKFIVLFIFIVFNM